MRLYILLVSVAFHSIAFSEPITKVLPVYTELDKNAFFSNEITRFEFVPDRFTLQYLNEQNTFRQEISTIEIESDIPESEPDILFSLVLDSNELVCYDENELIIEGGDESEIIVDVENVEMSKDESIDFNFNQVSEDGLRGANLDANFTFPKIPEKSKSCYGQIDVSIELTI